jgi:hypothetical protein
VSGQQSTLDQIEAKNDVVRKLEANGKCKYALRVNSERSRAYRHYSQELREENGEDEKLKRVRIEIVGRTGNGAAYCRIHGGTIGGNLRATQLESCVIDKPDKIIIYAIRCTLTRVTLVLNGARKVRSTSGSSQASANKSAPDKIEVNMHCALFSFFKPLILLTHNLLVDS